MSWYQDFPAISASRISVLLSVLPSLASIATTESGRPCSASFVSMSLSSSCAETMPAMPSATLPTRSAMPDALDVTELQSLAKSLTASAVSFVAVSLASSYLRLASSLACSSATSLICSILALICPVFSSVCSRTPE